MWIRIWTVVGLFLSLLGAEAIGAFMAIDNWVQAKRYSLASAPIETDIVIVALDSKSIAGMGQWPWPRTIHAQIVDKLVEAKARQIAFDLDFSSASSPQNDQAFQQALKAAGGSTILAGFRQYDGGKLMDTVPLAAFADNAWLASVSVRADSDGVIRSVPLSETLAGQDTPSLAAYLSQANVEEHGEINIDFAIASSSFPVISAIDLLQGDVPAGLLAGKDVIIGATAVELRDLFVTPTGEIIPGSVLQALAAETAKHGRSIIEPGLLLRGLGIFIIGLLGLLAARSSWRMQIALFGAIFMALELASHVLQWSQYISLPTASWLMAFAGLAVASTLSELDFRRLRIGSIQNRLGATKVLLQEVIADSPAGVIVVDDSNRIRVANPSALHILGAEKANWVGALTTEALPPDLAQLFDTPLHPHVGPAVVPRQSQISLQLQQATKVLDYSLTKSAVAYEGEGGSSATVRCLTFQDVTEHHAHLQRISYLALHDAKTGSRNRNSFIQDLEAIAQREQRATIVHFGIDRFKYVNEDFGHDVGDQLLNMLVARSKVLVEDSRPLYRIAGDEFAFILKNGADGDKSDKLAKDLLALGGTVYLKPYEIPFTISVGVAMTTGKNWNADEIVRRSGLALSSAKSSGGNRISTFNTRLDEAATRRKMLETALIGALERQEFHLLYQPQFDLASGQCVGVEALLRWTSPMLGSVSPGEFVPVAEQIGMIDDIGTWVIQHAAREIAEVSQDIFVAVNVSPRQFSRGKVELVVSSALAATGLPPSRFEVEVTESVLAENTAKTVETLKSLRSAGVTVALDDFGTGYSSLSYLLNLPLDKLKIDKSFVTGLPHDPKAGAVLNSILGVAKALGLETIAEGVETAEQRDALKAAGCHQGQGYLFAKEMNLESLSVLLEILGRGKKAPAVASEVAAMGSQALPQRITA